MSATLTLKPTYPGRCSFSAEARPAWKLHTCFSLHNRLETWKTLTWKKDVPHLLGNLSAAKPGSSSSAESLPPSRDSLTRAGRRDQHPTAGQGCDSRWRWRRVPGPGEQGCRSPVSVDDRIVAVARTPPITARLGIWLRPPLRPAEGVKRSWRQWDTGVVEPTGTIRDRHNIDRA